ncbi:MAG: hypothetical protein O7H41_08735 [Planctomycetota bacterium]|nr:hypothetical protein [Planctomycetota bacterium]
MSKKLKRRDGNGNLRPLTREQAQKGARNSAAKRALASEALKAIERGEYVRVEGDESDGKPCPLLESEQRKRREELGEPEPEPKFKVVDAIPVSPDLHRLQQLDHERRVRLLSDE